MTRKRILPKVMTGAIARGVLLHVDAWRLLAAFAATLALGGFPHPTDLTRYPAHFHINIRKGFRGGGIGPRLVDAFMQQAADAHVRGIHLVARGDNAAGRRFFEKLGFKLLFEKPLILPAGAWFRRTSTVEYGWSREA